MLCKIPVTLEGGVRCSDSGGAAQSSCVIPKEVVAKIMKVNKCDTIGGTIHGFLIRTWQIIPRLGYCLFQS
jgi:hypothetical protein